ncbi:Homeodomain-interacting protein kinase 1 [Araneus ventricosus]|uniref:Homeodomain-interacting protein kinase 1 n=1 Tax=Araneus ventricosus TaxID=182803 RepID=A0A4Y2HBQ1_ARAVE|nr:Homeodomain-interacting protein kinase 1 [Araneus ventricosus]
MKNFQPFQIASRDPRLTYDVLEYISEGSFGKVYKAKASGTPVALKMLKGEEVEDDVLREQHILETLQLSPMKDFFIHLKKSFKYEESYIQIYEYMDMDLHTYMQEYAIFPTKDARKLLHQLLLALNQLKDYGIIHADLKPENIMVNNNMALKVIDFGASHYAKKVWNHTQIVTLPYRAPEIILGAGYNEAIDMWAFGCIAAKMLINRTLYPGRSDFEMLAMIKQTHGDYPQRLLQSAKQRKVFFDLEGSDYILKDPAKFGYRIRDVGITLLEIASVTENVKFSSEGMRRRLELSDVVGCCLELDPTIRMQPADALESKFFAEKQWNDKDIISDRRPIANGKVPQSPKCTLQTPSAVSQTPTTGFRSRSPVIFSQ